MAFLSTLATAGIFSGVNAATELVMKYTMSDGSDEMKRSHLELEAFNEKKEIYQEQRQERLDYINKTLREEHHAQQTFTDLDAAMEQYYEITKQRLPPLEEPKIEDFIKPSETYKTVDLIVTAVVVTVIGIGGIYAYKQYRKKHI